jgi:4'-phosphopantetheinyl transferase
MIKVFYHKIVRIWEDEQRLTYLALLPNAMQIKILNYQSLNDRQAKIIGKLLLLKGLQSFHKEASLLDIKYDEKNKPYINGNIQFSITHSNNLIVVAASDNMVVGIDTEFIQPINILEMEKFFSHQEWKNLANNNFDVNIFYTYWTKKEAVLKASGLGIFGEFDTIEILNDEVEIDKRKYFHYPLIIDADYKISLVSSNKNEKIIISKVEDGEF